MCVGAQTMEPRPPKNALSWQVPTRRCSERRLRAAAMAMHDAAMAMHDAVLPDLLAAMKHCHIQRFRWA